MKVYIVTKEPFPNGMAATNRIKCYARAIIEGGLDCEVLIYGGSEIKGNRINNTDAKGDYCGVAFKYIGGTPILPKNKILRRLSQAKRLFLTYIYLLRKLCTGDILFLFMGGDVRTMLHFMSIAKSKKAFCVRDLCELPYGTGAETEYAIRMRRITIEEQFPKLNGIISISDALLNLAKTNTPSSCKHIKVPIMVEYEHYYINKQPQLDGIPYIFHAGTLYQQKDGILGMIEAFGMAKRRLNRPIKYVLTSNINASSHPEELKLLINKYKLEDSLEFVGYLNRDQIKDYLTKAALVISNRPKTRQDYYGFSTKVGEYLASGTPLLMTNWGEAVKWLKNGESAYIVEPEDTEALADAIVHIFSNPEESRRIGLVGQEVCRKCFDYRNWSRPLVDYLNQLGK